MDGSDSFGSLDPEILGPHPWPLQSVGDASQGVLLNPHKKD